MGACKFGNMVLALEQLRGSHFLGELHCVANAKHLDAFSDGLDRDVEIAGREDLC